MKLKHLNQKGFSHWLAPIVVVALIIGVGGYIQVRQSHADTYPGQLAVAQAACGKDYVRWPDRGYAVGMANTGGNPGIGVLEVLSIWDSSTKDYTICAVLVSGYNTYGQPKSMHVQIANNSGYQQDSGRYSQFAGPVKIHSQSRSGASVYGTVTYNGKLYSITWPQ